MMDFDMHVHTHYSSCSNMKPEKLVEYAKRAGLSGIALTDHNSLEGYNKIPKTQDFLVVPGVEVSTKDGDLIGLFIAEVPKLGLSSTETADLIREQGGLVMAPHPFDRLRHCVGNMLDEIKPDFIEVFNSRITFQEDNSKALRAAEKLGIKKIAGSDAHFPGELGHAGIKAQATTFEELRKALMQNKYEIFGRLSSPFVHIQSKISKLSHKLQ